MSMCVASATPILAQDASPPHGDPVVFYDVHGGAPLRLSGGAALLLPFGKITDDDNLARQNAVEIQASGGMGGARVAGGLAFLTGPFGPDVLFSVNRTWASPRGATAHATYLGLEGGYVWLILRVSAGVAQRVAGPAGPKATIFTWQVGAQVPLCTLRRHSSRKGSTSRARSTAPPPIRR
jgi:hypothetical protein